MLSGATSTGAANNGGVNRRRGQGTKPDIVISAQCLLIPLLVAGGLLMIWISSVTVAEVSTPATIGNPSVSAAKPLQIITFPPIIKADQKIPTTPKGTSLVDCTLLIPSNDDTVTETTTGVVHITVRHDLSPKASKVFINLVEARHFDGVFLFRVLKKFVAQFGVRHDGLPPEDPLPYKPSKADKDEPHETTLSNLRGTLSFAGGNPGTQQVFVNLNDDNRRLDKENSRPFATVDDHSMVNLFDKLYTGYHDGSGQVKTMKLGEQAMHDKFPYMSRIQHCRVVIKAEEMTTTTT